MNPLLIRMGLLFIELSLIAFGGGYTIFPEMERHFVEINHWLTRQEFYNLFAIAQSSPGPNTLIIPLAGWQVAGFAGLLVSTFASYGTSLTTTLLAMRGWDYFNKSSWRPVVQAALIPLTIGLLTASCLTIARAVSTSTLYIVIIFVGIYLSLFTRLNPIWILFLGALTGLILG